MICVTFVCLGNICRSPMAQLIFEKLIKERGVAERFIVDSCGTSSEEEGNSVYPPAQRTLRAHGVEGAHTARKITRRDFERSDYLIAMDESNYRTLLALAGEKERSKIYKLCSFTDRPRDVADPWYTRDFERAYSDISDGCRALLEYLKRLF